MCPVFKKNDSLIVKTLGLSVFCRIYGKKLKGQCMKIWRTLWKIKSLLTGFRKKHSTQHCLVSMFEEWKKKLDNDKIIGKISMDLWKAFDTINHDLLIAKLEGLSDTALLCMKSYLNNWKQCVTVSSTFSS